MSKALPVLGIVASVLAALGATVFLAPTTFLLPIIAGAVGLLLILERQPVGLIAGIVAILFALMSLFGLIGNLTFKGGAGAGAPMTEELGQALAIGACLIAAGGVMLARAEAIVPAWVGYAGLACVLVGFVMALVLQNHIPPPYSAAGLPTFALALIALATVVPQVVAMRGAAAA